MKEYSVSELNKHIKRILSDDYLLRNICIKGEISNCKYHGNGHIYFSMKDEKSSIQAVIWNSSSRPDFRLEDGMNVIAVGGVSVYEAGGTYSFNIREIKLEGVGKLYEKLAILREEFMQMGYFSSKYKKPVPQYSSNVGIVTAPAGAAIRDICRIARNRNPYVRLVLYPAIVQGDNAVASIVEGIRTLDEMDLDTIIVGRGGGSIEDLWAFNEKDVVEAIFCSNTPIISAVGHESDVSLSDLVADVRAATPTEAAVLAVADLEMFEKEKDRYLEKLRALAEVKITDLRRNLEKRSLELRSKDPTLTIQKTADRLAVEKKRLDYAMKTVLNAKRNKLASAASILNNLSPLSLLSSGYGYIENSKNERVSGVDDIDVEETIKIYFTDGSALATVKEKKHEKH